MRLRFLILAILILQSALAAASTHLVSPWIVNPDNGHWYALTTNAAWVEAEVLAIKNGGHLATIRSQAEQNFITQTFSAYAGESRLLWIGLNDSQTQGLMTWTSGEPVSYTNWYPGEPNGNAGQEDFVGIYPPNVPDGKWNDFWLLHNAAGANAYGVVERDPANVVDYPIRVATGYQWKYIAPEGNKIGQDMNSVGLAFEAAHPDWNTNVAFDTSDWLPSQYVHTDTREDYIWGARTASPVYFRHTFTLDGPVTDAVLLVTVDDNALLYINGHLVINDPSGGASGFGPWDVTQYLQQGENLIAVKAQDIGVYASLSVHLFAVPEPPAVVLAALGCAAFCGLAIRRRRASHSAL